MRIAVVAAAISIAIIGISAAADVDAAMKKPTRIPAQRLDRALQMLAADHGLAMAYRSELVAGLQTAGASGDLTRDEALTQLLSGTGLSYRFLDEKTVTIVPLTQRGSEHRLDSHETPTAPRSSGPTEISESSQKPQRISFWDRFRLAQASSDNDAVTRSAIAPGNGDSASGEKVEEIVVTAQKRLERLIDTPQSVSVLSVDSLSKLAATQFRDFANAVPGLSFSSQGAGTTQVTLRGVTAGLDVSPTVGIYVDDVPYGSSSSFAQSAQGALDVALFDLDRIEVLRGPQGTLYGASTMGGLIKYVTRQPDTSAFGVDAQTGLAGTQDGGMSYNGAIAVNAPLASDRAALRASAFMSRNGGYIENVTLDRKDINRSDIYGGRLDLLLKPTDGLQIRLTGFAQNILRDGEDTADFSFSGAPLDGELDVRRPIREPFEQHFRLVSGAVSYDFGGSELTSISSYQTSDADFISDLTPAYGPYCAYSVVQECSSVGYLQNTSTDKFTQEVRLASQGKSQLEWLVGGFYTHENSGRSQEFLLRDVSGQLGPNDLFTFSTPSKYEEYAGFGDLTWHFNDRFDVSGGVRYARNEQTFVQFGGGLFGAARDPASSQETVHTYLTNARYHFNENSTGYLRYATGYRPGGPNFIIIDTVTGLPLGPATFDSDRLKSYEAGWKSQTADGRFSIDTSVYFIDWNNIQIGISRGGFGFTGNAPGGATIRGAEIALTLKPVSALAITGGLTFQDAQLSDADADLGGTKGQQLPNVPRFTGTLDGEYRFASSGLSPVVGATVRYVDDRLASWDQNLNRPQYRLPSYTAVDLRAGIKVRSVDALFYIRNAFDERGQLFAYTWQGLPRPTLQQPRTFGLNLTTHF